jgi:predicted transcriptional regulator
MQQYRGRTFLMSARTRSALVDYLKLMVDGLYFRVRCIESRNATMSRGSTAPISMSPISGRTCKSSDCTYRCAVDGGAPRVRAERSLDAGGQNWPYSGLHARTTNEIGPLMHAALLIDAIVRQTTVLIGTLATASGQRAQLAHIANLVFADLVRELREQGLGNKVIADMFGMALRTYRRRVARLSASSTEQGHSLWEAVLRHIQQHGPLSRGDVLQRFNREDDAVLRSVLLDLVETGLVQRRGSDDASVLEAAAPAPRVKGGAAHAATLESLVLVALHRTGPLGARELSELVPAAADEIEAVLAQLVRSGVVVLEQRGEERRYRCESYVIGFGDEAGWEAAVFDHFQAMVVALVTKLRGGARKADLADEGGGSTFVFDLWAGHPMQAQVLGFLRAVREQGMALRRELERHAAAAPMPADATPLRVVAYVGQSVTRMEDEDV